MANYRILCCDGGGIRGLLTALIIRKLHSEVGILDQVDLCAGTSTGGIIALGLAGGVGIDRIVDLYQNNAAEIFKRPEGLGTRTGEFLKKQVSNVAKRIPGVTDELIDSIFTYQDELWYPKYGGEGLRKLLSKLFPTDPTLGALPGKSKVLVTTFQLHDNTSGSWRPVALHNLAMPGNDPHLSHAVESAMCTSAAPTFFPPHNHLKLGYCIDGGVFANNPSSLALATALESGVPRESIRMLSIGTGGTMSSMTITKEAPFSHGANNYGILGWLLPTRRGKTPSYPLLNLLFDAGSSTSELLAGQVLGPAFRRVQVPLKSSIGLDDIQAADSLKAAAEGLFASDMWPKIRSWAEVNFA